MKNSILGIALFYIITIFSSCAIPNSNNEQSSDTTLNGNQIESIELQANSETIKIGNQVWMINNLNVDTFRNGDLIPEVVNVNGNWSKSNGYDEGSDRTELKYGTPAWLKSDDDPIKAKKYGKYYNWFAVIDPRGLAPKGWHVPSFEEWQQLFTYLSLSNEAGKIMRSKEWNGNNESGFSALPAGYGPGNGSNENDRTVWWSSSFKIDSLVGGYYEIPAAYLNYENQLTFIRAFWESDGHSVRCIKDYNETENNSYLKAQEKEKNEREISELQSIPETVKIGN